VQGRTSSLIVLGDLQIPLLWKESGDCRLSMTLSTVSLSHSVDLCNRPVGGRDFVTAHAFRDTPVLVFGASVDDDSMHWRFSSRSHQS
jgi:hypothetical protein